MKNHENKKTCKELLRLKKIQKLVTKIESFAEKICERIEEKPILSLAFLPIAAVIILLVYAMIVSEIALILVFASIITIVGIAIYVGKIVPDRIDAIEFPDVPVDKKHTIFEKFAFILYTVGVVFVWFMTFMVAFYEVFPAFLFSDLSFAILIAPTTICIVGAFLFQVGKAVVSIFHRIFDFFKQKSEIKKFDDARR